MCYDISFTINVKQLTDYFPDLVFDDQIKFDFDNAVHIIGHSYGLHPIIYKNREDEKLHAKLMEWGCIPFYVQELKPFARQRASMLNARSERILADNKSYWYKIRNRRCLVPMTGFYEHRKVAGLTKKVPYLIGLKKQPMFFLPGLYSVAKLPDENGEQQELWTFTIVTRKANKVMAQIHNDGDNTGRMPLMLPLELSRQWVNDELSEEAYNSILAFEMPSEELNYHTVYTIRSPKPRPDEKGKDQFYAWEKVPEIVV
ncbi:MAG: SOS response-associated peptidase family protein [Gloeobacteraceae cyanobacterium ES-bin-316]|nr:SOS response-associated peptidase family protein [Ferruginibacter sp.]